MTPQPLIIRLAFTALFIALILVMAWAVGGLWPVM